MGAGAAPCALARHLVPKVADELASLPCSGDGVPFEGFANNGAGDSLSLLSGDSCGWTSLPGASTPVVTSEGETLAIGRGVDEGDMGAMRRSTPATHFFSRFFRVLALPGNLNNSGLI